MLLAILGVLVLIVLCLPRWSLSCSQVVFSEPALSCRDAGYRAWRPAIVLLAALQLGVLPLASLLVLYLKRDQVSSASRIHHAMTLV